MVEDEFTQAKALRVLVKNSSHVPTKKEQTTDSRISPLPAGKAESGKDIATSSNPNAGGEPRFSFAPQPPGAKPVTDPKMALRRKPGRYKIQAPPTHPIRSWDEDGAQLLQEDWSDDYWLCSTFMDPWQSTQISEFDWPEGFKVLKKKMYHLERLCVPTDRVVNLITAHHRWNAHQGEERLVPDLFLHYEFPEDIDVPETVKEIKKSCLVCQACQAPTWPLKGPIDMTPIPPRVMTSVALDIFHMPEVTYEDERYNCFRLCVDRHSGWMVARPTTEDGLTGKKAVQLMLNTTWGEMGLPSIITSDQGPQFVSEWWKQMCSRLGVRQAYSQAYRHQANGRAEVAGRVVQDLLRKLHTQSAINWVEALPRVLRIQHDSRYPILGISTYQTIFSPQRARALAAIPYGIVMEAQEPLEYFEHMDFLDKNIAEKLNAEHKKIADSINAHRRTKKPFAVGDWVWHLKPKPIGGMKMATYWDGPCRVLARVGDSSYQLKDTFGKTIDAHVTGLKPYVFEILTGPILNLEIPPPAIPAAQSDEREGEWDDEGNVLSQ